MNKRLDYYFEEDELKNLVIRYKRTKNNSEKQQILEKICVGLMELNNRIINKKLYEYCRRYNLVQSSSYIQTEKEDLLNEMLLQQISQIERYDETKNSKFFSFLTAIQENVIKYRIQNLVKETNYFVYLDNNSNNIMSDGDVSSPIEFLNPKIEKEYHIDKKNTLEHLFDHEEVINDFNSLNILKFFEKYNDLLKDNAINNVILKINKLLKNLKNKQSQKVEVKKILEQFMILNKYLLYFYYRNQINTKRKYKKKKKRNMYDFIFEIEKNLKYVKDFSKIVFRQSKPSLKSVYDLFSDTDEQSNNTNNENLTTT